jgi:hypothetical protein
MLQEGLLKSLLRVQAPLCADARSHRQRLKQTLPRPNIQRPGHSLQRAVLDNLTPRSRMRRERRFH